MRYLIIIIVFSFLYAPNKNLNLENELDVIQFETLWNSILIVETNKKHYRNGRIVVSHKGAIGIAQVMPNTFLFIINNSKSYHLVKSDIYNKELNLWAGKWYFSYLYYDVFPNDFRRAVSAYNGGHNNSRFMTKYFNKVMNV